MRNESGTDDFFVSGEARCEYDGRVSCYLLVPDSINEEWYEVEVIPYISTRAMNSYGCAAHTACLRLIDIFTKSTGHRNAAIQPSSLPEFIYAYRRRYDGKPDTFYGDAIPWDHQFFGAETIWECSMAWHCSYVYEWLAPNRFRILSLSLLRISRRR